MDLFCDNMNRTHPVTDELASGVPDLVQSFSKLLLNASGDADTLNKFQSMISNEFERISNTDSNPNTSIGSNVDLFATDDI